MTQNEEACVAPWKHVCGCGNNVHSFASSKSLIIILHFSVLILVPKKKPSQIPKEAIHAISEDILGASGQGEATPRYWVNCVPGRRTRPSVWVMRSKALPGKQSQDVGKIFFGAAKAREDATFRRLRDSFFCSSGRRPCRMRPFVRT